MDAKLVKMIEGMEPDLIATLEKWIAVPSVKEDAAPEAPFGREVRRMLDMALDDAKAMGFKVRNIDGYAGDVEVGEGDEAIAVLGHLDVVPAGDAWQTPPFTPVREGDKIYGRGTSDDKGPVIAALYAMKAIKDAGIPLKKKIRLILGCDEESGWGDMTYYTAHCDMPEVGFSPDASFPVINTEKGVAHLALHAQTACDGLQVKRMITGERINVIPGNCEALVAGDATLVTRTAEYAAKTGLPYSAQVVENGVLLHAAGIPGHSAYPEGRRNAIGMMLLLMKELGVSGALGQLADAVGMEHDGASLGVKCSDKESGELTCNMGILHVEDSKIYATLDFRCPITVDPKHVADTATAHLSDFRADVLEFQAPHHVPEDSELVRSLLAAYHEETGLKPEALSTGGGTYAKVLKQGVAFGASFPDDEDLAHQAGEYAKISGLMASVRTFVNALLRLAGE